MHSELYKLVSLTIILFNVINILLQVYAYFNIIKYQFNLKNIMHHI